MRKALLITVFLAGGIAFMGCTSRNTLVRPAKAQPPVEESAHSDKPVSLALAYYREGSFRRSAEYFEEAARHFRETGNKANERRAITAAAKTHLKCSQRGKFLDCAYRLDGLIGRWEMPSDDERLLLNMAAAMQGLALPFPVKDPLWRTILTEQ